MDNFPSLFYFTNMKFTLRTIYYILVGIFYRKDIRIVHYRMERNGDERFPHYPIYMQSEIDGTVCENEVEAIKRLQASNDITRKDRINMNRLLFADEYSVRLWKKETSRRSIICKYYWLYVFHVKIYNTFLSDLLIGKKADPITPNDYCSAWWNMLKLIKRYGMDYSNTIEHELEL